MGGSYPWCGVQVVWVSVGDAAWLTTDSDQFFIDLALRSAADSRYDGKRPRLRVRPYTSPSFPSLILPTLHRCCLQPAPHRGARPLATCESLQAGLL